MLLKKLNVRRWLSCLLVTIMVFGSMNLVSAEEVTPPSGDMVYYGIYGQNLLMNAGSFYIRVHINGMQDRSLYEGKTMKFYTSPDKNPESLIYEAPLEIFDGIFSLVVKIDTNNIIGESGINVDSVWYYELDMEGHLPSENSGLTVSEEFVVDIYGPAFQASMYNDTSYVFSFFGYMNEWEASTFTGVKIRDNSSNLVVEIESLADINFVVDKTGNIPRYDVLIPKSMFPLFINVSYELILEKVAGGLHLGYYTAYQEGGYPTPGPSVGAYEITGLYKGGLQASRQVEEHFMIFHNNHGLSSTNAISLYLKGDETKTNLLNSQMTLETIEHYQYAIAVDLHYNTQPISGESYIVELSNGTDVATAEIVCYDLTYWLNHRGLVMSQDEVYLPVMAETLDESTVSELNGKKIGFYTDKALTNKIYESTIQGPYMLNWLVVKFDAKQVYGDNGVPEGTQLYYKMLDAPHIGERFSETQISTEAASLMWIDYDSLARSWQDEDATDYVIGFYGQGYNEQLTGLKGLSLRLDNNVVYDFLDVQNQNDFKVDIVPYTGLPIQHIQLKIDKEKFTPLKNANYYLEVELDFTSYRHGSYRIHDEDGGDSGQKEFQVNIDTTEIVPQTVNGSEQVDLWLWGYGLVDNTFSVVGLHKESETSMTNLLHGSSIISKDKNDMEWMNLVVTSNENFVTGERYVLILSNGLETKAVSFKIVDHLVTNLSSTLTLGTKKQQIYFDIASKLTNPEAIEVSIYSDSECTVKIADATIKADSVLQGSEYFEFELPEIAQQETVVYFRLDNLTGVVGYRESNELRVGGMSFIYMHDSNKVLSRSFTNSSPEYVIELYSQRLDENLSNIDQLNLVLFDSQQTKISLKPLLNEGLVVELIQIEDSAYDKAIIKIDKSKVNLGNTTIFMLEIYESFLEETRHHIISPIFRYTPVTNNTIVSMDRFNDSPYIKLEAYNFYSQEPATIGLYEKGVALIDANNLIESTSIISGYYSDLYQSLINNVTLKSGVVLDATKTYILVTNIDGIIKEQELKIPETISFDVTGDGFINFRDVFHLSNFYHSDDPVDKAFYDINNDGIIDILDLVEISRKLSK